MIKELTHPLCIQRRENLLALDSVRALARGEFDTVPRSPVGGCPIFAVIQGRFWAAGVHVGTRELNEAVRINPQVLEEMMSWRA